MAVDRVLALIGSCWAGKGVLQALVCLDADSPTPPSADLAAQSIGKRPRGHVLLPDVWAPKVPMTTARVYQPQRSNADTDGLLASLFQVANPNPGFSGSIQSMLTIHELQSITVVVHDKTQTVVVHDKPQTVVVGDKTQTAGFSCGNSPHHPQQTPSPTFAKSTFHGSSLALHHQNPTKRASQTH